MLTVIQSLSKGAHLSPLPRFLRDRARKRRVSSGATPSVESMGITVFIPMISSRMAVRIVPIPASISFPESALRQELAQGRLVFEMVEVGSVANHGPRIPCGH